MEFEVVGDRNNFIDWQKIYLEIKCRILQTDGTDLRYTHGDANASDLLYFADNILHSLFAYCTVSANDIKISTANGHYAHKSFIETEFSHGTRKENLAKITVRQSAHKTLYGKLAVDFFSCEKHLVSGVTLRMSMRRSQDDFAVISEDAAKPYKVKIDEANLFIRKMTVSDNVVGAIANILLITAAIY